MLPEIKTGREIPAELHEYLRANYPTTQEEIGQVLHFAEEAGRKNKYYDAVGSLMSRAGERAEKKGIAEVPAILEAIRFLEVSIPDSEKRLTPQKYVELLAKGETASSNLAYWNNRMTHEEQIKDAAEHSGKAQKLYKFLLETKI